jgi:hypothetical protein
MWLKENHSNNQPNKIIWRKNIIVLNQQFFFFFWGGRAKPDYYPSMEDVTKDVKTTCHYPGTNYKVLTTVKHAD